MKEKKKHQETKARWNAKRTKTELAAAADAARGSATNAPYHSKQTKTKSKQTQTKSEQTQTKSKQTQTPLDNGPLTLSSGSGPCGND